MKKSILIFAIIVTLGLAIWWYAREPDSGAALESAETGVNSAVLMSQMEQDVAPHVGQHSESGRSASFYLSARNERGFRQNILEHAPSLPPPDFTKRNPTALDAVTPEEAVWLDQHGYPTGEELATLSTTSELELAQRAAEGDVTALGLLGLKQLQREETLGAGYDNLSEAALQGSIWAIIALARHQSAYGNQNEAFALYNIAALRGDWLSPSTHMVTMPNQLAQREYISVPGRTASWFANLQALRKERRLSPLQNRMRPNQFNRPNTLDREVGIYRRGG